MRWNLSGQGLSGGLYFSNAQFRKIKNYVTTQTRSLKNAINKTEFRNKCLSIAEYLIREKDKRPQEFRKENWEAALKTWMTYYLSKGESKYGVCPAILEKSDKDLLILKYSVEDFIEQNEEYKSNLKPYQVKYKFEYKCNNKNNCTKTCGKYNEWFNDRKSYFEGKKELILQNCKNDNPIFNFPKNKCYSLMQKTLVNVPICIESTSPKELKVEKKQEASSVGTLHSTERQGDVSSKLPSSKKILIAKESHDTSESSSSPESEALLESTELRVNQEKDQTYPPLETASESRTSSSNNVSIISSKSTGMFKNKKDIKRRQVKFLRIIIPSHYKKKIQFLSHDNLEGPINDREQIIKKIKIQEHNIKKNEDMLHRKKERSVTMIEVHMEILEECRSKEWEYNKGEFLEICQEVLKKEENIIDTNLTDDEVIMENIKSTSDIENQKILWNKWMQRHKNFSEKLRKECWFNNLKNEWKEEKSYVKNSEEFKKLLSSDNKKDPFLEREKDTWTQWTSKKGTFVEEHLEKDWFERLTEEVYNMSDAYENEGKKNDALFINKEELENKENYEELFKYFKTKLLKKLCILVFMMILEDCKKEEYIENRESHFDNSINEWMTEENSGNKPEIEENLIDTNSDILQNRKNNKINTYKEEDCFRQELDEWIKENDAHVNSLDSNNNVNKFDQIVE
ncbi:STP1 protein [Plasmodium malariae]|uniref:STP1 protein n=1 Tax=Plasmodium malariae TaxID=5858 RepID=A0A1A8X6S5_PLAMA|nr:STP1 protein [Plasmodium malariae]